MYKVRKIFTSRDGRLEPDSREYGMTPEGLEEIGEARNHLGGATHIFVKTRGGPSNQVRFFTRNEQLSFVRAEKETGWAEYELNKDATYKPERGERGWWNVEVADAPSERVEGIGLPDSWHVSTFVVFEWENSGTETPGEGPEVPQHPGEKILKLTFSLSVDGYAVAVALYTDGTYEMDEAR